MARTRNPKSKIPLLGMGFPPEVEIAVKRATEEKDLSIKAYVRYAVRQQLIRDKYLRA